MHPDFIDDEAFILFAAKHYENPQCYGTEEFYDDLKRFKYLKRLFGKYSETGELRERLIINHLIILYNVFGNTATTMLFYKLDSYHSSLVPFLVFLNRLPQRVNIGKIIYTSDIQIDKNVVEVLRKIN